MRYRLAIFDFDGTLADSFPWVMGMMNEVADRFKFRRVEDHEVESLRMCDARETLVIGDEIRDLDASRKARMPFGAVSWGSTRPPAFIARAPDYLFDNVADITAAILGDAG